MINNFYIATPQSVDHAAYVDGPTMRAQRVVTPQLHVGPTFNQFITMLPTFTIIFLCQVNYSGLIVHKLPHAL